MIYPPLTVFLETSHFFVSRVSPRETERWNHRLDTILTSWENLVSNRTHEEKRVDLSYWLNLGTRVYMSSCFPFGDHKDLVEPYWEWCRKGVSWEFCDQISVCDTFGSLYNTIRDSLLHESENSVSPHNLRSRKVILGRLLCDSNKSCK